MMNRTQIILSPLAVIAMLATPALTHAESTTKPQDRVDALLKAIANNDSTAFTADATPAMKKAITPEAFDNLHATLGKRLGSKHTVTYLGDLNEKGYHVHLWKLTIDDGGDDVLVHAVLSDDNALAGFFLQ